MHSNYSYRVIIEEYYIQIFPYRKNTCANHTFYHTTNAYNFYEVPVMTRSFSAHTKTWDVKIPHKGLTMKYCKILQSKLSTEHAFTFHYKTTCETETGVFYRRCIVVAASWCFLLWENGTIGVKTRKVGRTIC